MNLGSNLALNTKCWKTDTCMCSQNSQERDLVLRKVAAFVTITANIVLTITHDLGS
jgi:hypothetical protein